MQVSRAKKKKKQKDKIMDFSTGWNLFSSNDKPSKLHITVHRGRAHKKAAFQHHVTIFLILESAQKYLVWRSKSRLHTSWSSNTKTSC